MNTSAGHGLAPAQEDALARVAGAGLASTVVASAADDGTGGMRSMARSAVNSGHFHGTPPVVAHGGPDDAARFPPMAPTVRDRASALLGRFGPLVWLYALVPVPLLTDWIENGSPPTSPGGWLTEVCGGLVITALVWRVRRDRRALEALARSDGLTGLLNRRSFETAIAAECTRARRTRQPLCVVYIDIDKFKGINDRFGHGAGDQVLRQLTAGIRATIRAGVDAGFRLGGDEFALLLPSTLKAQAESIVARLRTFCAVHDPRWAIGTFDFSAGVVELEPDDTAAGLMTRSDAAMYREKNSRRTAQRA